MAVDKGWADASSGHPPAEQQAPGLSRHVVHPWCWCPRQCPLDFAAGSTAAARVCHPSPAAARILHAARERSYKAPDCARTRRVAQSWVVAGLRRRSDPAASIARRTAAVVRHSPLVARTARQVPRRETVEDKPTAPVATTPAPRVPVPVATTPALLVPVVPTPAPLPVAPTQRLPVCRGQPRDVPRRYEWDRSDPVTPCRSWGTRSPWGHIWCHRMDRTSSPRALKPRDNAQTTDVDLSTGPGANPASRLCTLLSCLTKRNRQPAFGRDQLTATGSAALATSPDARAWCPAATTNLPARPPETVAP
jgi:hypothetical protein